ncbi:MAG: GMC family oxidoreductase [Cytophagaceae bacterium]|nr:MAG: GMC family oxidoreductase [Cytophagaceae bacterium]
MTSAIRKVRERLPWTDKPSIDKKSYLTNGTKIVLDAFTNQSAPNSFRYITANEDPDRDHTTSHTEFFFQNGEKGGPMATYLVTASRRKNFQLQMNTTVGRVLRKGDTATGVDVQSAGPGGLTGTVKLTPESGRVILSAGVFNTFKILIRSGIGPIEEVQRLANASAEAAKLPPKKDWLNLKIPPVLSNSRLKIFRL